MSVKRSVIANVLNLEEEKIKCKNCVSYEKSNRCHLWDCFISGEEFCSMFELKEGQNGPDSGRESVE